jgi:ABC-type Fe3+/spermidine/putrescine transport system ATPase subunit
MELRRLAKELGLTAIHVTHDQEEAMSISDRIVIMRAGQIVEVGKPQDLYLNPRQIFTANFLGEANFMRSRLVGGKENGAVLDVEGEQLKIQSSTVPEDAVVAIRPQFVRITRRRTDDSGWKGKITEKTFLGDAVRFQLNLDNGLKITAQTPSTAKDIDVDVGDVVSANFQRDKLLTFRYPTDGLEKELSAW